MLVLIADIVLGCFLFRELERIVLVHYRQTSEVRSFFTHLFLFCSKYLDFFTLLLPVFFCFFFHLHSKPLVILMRCQHVNFIKNDTLLNVNVRLILRSQWLGLHGFPCKRAWSSLHTWKGPKREQLKELG